MIFVTVGTQLSFDRLIQAVNKWAEQENRNDVFAQIGPNSWHPPSVTWSEFVGTDEFRERVEQADVVVAHAGMGSIITALELGKPILVMPRRADLGEHRNDHQMATAKRFLEQGRIHVAFDEEELLSMLHDLDHLKVRDGIEGQANQELINGIRGFIWAKSAKL